jgi:hypothetical protein
VGVGDVGVGDVGVWVGGSVGVWEQAGVGVDVGTGVGVGGSVGVQEEVGVAVEAGLGVRVGAVVRDGIEIGVDEDAGPVAHAASGENRARTTNTANRAVVSVEFARWDRTRPSRGKCACRLFIADYEDLGAIKHIVVNCKRIVVKSQVSALVHGWALVPTPGG